MGCRNVMQPSIFYMTASEKFEGVKVSNISVFLGPGIRNIYGHYFI